MFNNTAILALADGRIFKGISIGATGDCVGELVINTAMTGYQEILTDPSYTKQIIMLTTAHVGNTGCNDEDMESSKVCAAGLVIRNCSNYASNYRSNSTFISWLKNHNIIAIASIDTRHLTLCLRDIGSINACISTNVTQHDLAIAKAQQFPGIQNADLASKVSRNNIESWQTGNNQWHHYAPAKTNYHVVVYDFGVKNNILRILYDKGCTVTIVPATTTIETVMQYKPDGILLSNGPGDPQACTYAIEITKKYLQMNMPILGICLGLQILALACEAKAIKMKFGHHGANHPVIAVHQKPMVAVHKKSARISKVFITSQNHGFAIDEDSLPSCLRITYRSLFDNSLQGIEHIKKPALGFQGHPEASPGPHDIEIIFDKFIALMHKKDKE